MPRRPRDRFQMAYDMIGRMKISEIGCNLNPICTQNLPRIQLQTSAILILSFRLHGEEKTNDVTAACAFCLAGVIACIARARVNRIVEGRSSSCVTLNSVRALAKPSLFERRLAALLLGCQPKCKQHQFEMRILEPAFLRADPAMEIAWSNRFPVAHRAHDRTSRRNVETPLGSCGEHCGTVD